MEMIKKLKKVGNSQALILDQSILKTLGLDPGASVQLTVTEDSLVVTRAQAVIAGDEKFEAALDRVMKTRRKLLKRLSK